MPQTQASTDYWNQTGLSFDLLKQTLNGEFCNASPIQRIGCLSAVEAVLEGAGKILVWERGKGFSFADRSADWDSDWVLHFRKNREAAENRERQWQGIDQVDFVSLWRDVQKVGGMGGATAAAAFNAFYATTVDPNARLQPEKEFNDELQASGQQTSGIGILVKWTQGMTIVQSPVEGAPAAEAGLRAGDWITHINGNDVRGLKFDDVASRIAGEAGTSVQLHVRRKTEEKTFSVERREVTLPNVSHRVIQTERGKWGYVRVRDLVSSSVCDEVQWALWDFRDEHAQGLILDLRDNLGGQVKQGGVCVASLFLPKDQNVLTEKNRKNAKEYTYTTWEKAVSDLPMVTLINGYTASAAEIVAGALQGLDRSLIVGARSYGKGTIQSASRWPHANGVFLFETTDCFLLPPDKHSNQVVGVIPDIEAYATADADDFALRESVLTSHSVDCGGQRYSPSVEKQTALKRAKDCIANSGQTPHHADLAGDHQLLTAVDAISCWAR